MVQFRLSIVALIIGVLQVCTANPISTEEEFDVTKLFSADELQRAKDAGFPVERLVEGKLQDGLTFDEMMKLHQLRNSAGPKKTSSPQSMYPACQILVPDLTFPESYTGAQETNLLKLVAATDRLEGRQDHIRFVRASVCTYLGQPDKFDTEANSFGLPLVSYMEIRYMTMKAEKAKGPDRVKVVKQMCCLNKHRDEMVMLDKSTFTGLPDGDMNEFDEHWNQYEMDDTLKSFLILPYVLRRFSLMKNKNVSLQENICDFLDTKDQTNDECVVAIPVPNAADQK